MYAAGNPLEEIGRFFRSKSVIARLIIINSVIWLSIGVLRVISFLFNLQDSSVINFVVDFLALPANTGLALNHPWTLITYMFLHIDFFHILFNMLWLFWFGKIFLEFMKARQLLWVYLLGGISGGLLYILFYNIFPVFEKSVDQSFALGASASVMAIVTAISVYVPGYTVQLLFIGRTRILYIAAILFVLDFFMIRSSNAGGHIAHIGGALFGLSYIVARRKGMNFDWFLSDIRSARIFRRPRKKRYSATDATFTFNNDRPLSDEDYNRRKAERQKVIDNILDKISKSGYESLSKEEKEILFRSGNPD